MRIGVEATCWSNNRGYGRHLRSLLHSLIRLDSNNQYTLFVDHADSGFPLPGRCNVRVVNAATPASVAASASGRRSLPDLARMSRAISSEPLDIVLMPTVYSYVPVLTRAKKAVMIHDAIAETFPELTTPNASLRLFWRTKVALARFQADAVITVSDYSRKRLEQSFPSLRGKILVAGEAPDPVFRVLEAPVLPPPLKQLGIRTDRPIVIYVGGFGPHKNLSDLARAFSRVATESNAQLVLVGEYRNEVFHSAAGELRGEIDALGLAGRVFWTGYVPDTDLTNLLNLSTVLVLPSLMEGYGLPAVEAAACGCPVIVTKESPLPEILGGGAIAIDPHEAAIEEALLRVLRSSGLRERMRDTAISSTRRLTWDNAAREMMTVFAHLSPTPKITRLHYDSRKEETAAK